MISACLLAASGCASESPLPESISDQPSRMLPFRVSAVTQPPVRLSSGRTGRSLFSAAFRVMAISSTSHPKAAASLRRTLSRFGSRICHMWYTGSWFEMSR